MKYVILVCGGMADRPLMEYNNETPMSKAVKPAMDFLASKSETGLVKTVPCGIKPSVEEVNFSIMGYDSRKCLSGVSVFEAENADIQTQKEDVILRCDFVTLSDEEIFEEKTMIDVAYDVSQSENLELINYIEKNAGNEIFSFVTGTNGKHFVIWKKGEPHPGKLTPTVEVIGQPVYEYLPKGDFTPPLYSLMEKSAEVLKECPVNQKRTEEGKDPVSSVWIWGESTRPNLDSFESRFGLKGSLISKPNSIRGMGKVTGMTVCGDDDVVKTALEELKRGQDLVYIYNDDAEIFGLAGDSDGKIKSIEETDTKTVKPLIDGLKSTGEDFAVMILSDLAVPLQIQNYASDPVPYLIYRSSNETESGISEFNENTAADTGIYIENACTLINRLIKPL